MTTDDDAPPLPPRRSDQDATLALLSKIANVEDAEIPVRLFTSSGVLSGILVSGDTFFRSLTELTNPHHDESEPPSDSLSAVFYHLAQSYQRNVTEERDLPVDYVHIRDGWLFTPGEQPMEVGLWRGRVSKLEGWSLGRYAPSPAAGATAGSDDE